MTGKFQEIPGYEMLSELGEGGMATVYLAIQHSLDRKVAIKVMRRELRVTNGPMPEFERRFLLEGRTMAKLPHRNIVAVYDIVTREEIAYISMEYLEGGTLSERMRDGVSLGEAIGVVVQLASGLEFAHRNGVIHRDLKPSNVMFRDATTPVLTDFGIAKQSDVMASRITQTGLVLGTPTYMSPEQASGRDTDGRSDQYALGILFYELLTGKPPFTGDNPMTVLMGHALQAPPPLPADLAPLQPVFDRMLAKTPDDRFANLQDFTRALRGIVVGNSNNRGPPATGKLGQVVDRRSDPDEADTETLATRASQYIEGLPADAARRANHRHGCCHGATRRPLAEGPAQRGAELLRTAQK